MERKLREELGPNPSSKESSKSRKKTKKKKKGPNKDPQNPNNFITIAALLMVLYVFSASSSQSGKPQEVEASSDLFEQNLKDRKISEVSIQQLPDGNFKISFFVDKTAYYMIVADLDYFLNFLDTYQRKANIKEHHFMKVTYLPGLKARKQNSLSSERTGAYISMFTTVVILVIIRSLFKGIRGGINEMNKSGGSGGGMGGP